MRLIGLTGGIGMGKSTAGELLRQLGAQVLDTDEIARALVKPGQPSLERIRIRFGDGILRQDGELDRQKLGLLVFADESARRDLEEILHPEIRRTWQSQAAQWKEQGVPIVVITVPLLFETGAESEFHTTICCACSNRSQQERLMQRGWSGGHLDQRIGSQWPISKKIALSNYVVWTDVPVAAHKAQLEHILARLA
jgi:dephospho-CoA kinase